MQDTPYRRSAKLYALGGWSPVPMTAGDPAHPKGVPLAGWTGRAGALVTLDHLPGLLAIGDHPNVSLRANGWIGIDVDDGYGNKAGAAQRAEIEKLLGPLPPTCRSTARGPGVSGIYIYRIPPGVTVLPEGYNFDLYGDSIEVIRYEHRYVKCWPTVHPNGNEYRWYWDDKAMEGNAVPGLYACPMLPDAWLHWLTTDNRASVMPGNLYRDRDTGEERIFCDLLDVERFLDAHRAKAMETEQGAGFNDALNAYAYALGAFVPEFYSETEAWDLCAEICEHHFGTTNAADRATITSALRSAPPFNARRPDPNGNPFGPDLPYLQPARVASHSVTSDKQIRTDLGVTPQGNRLVLQSAASIGMESSDWLWKHGREHWIPLGGLVLLGGREGVGKSTWTARLVAQVTRGKMEGEHLGNPKGVIICATEDAWAQTIVPRLAAAGANLNLVWRVDARITETTLGSISLPHDVAELAAVMTGMDVALLVLDPLLGTINGKLDSHKDQDVRIALEPISRLAADTQATVLGLIHQNKTQAGDLLTRLMGSRAFSAVARAVLVCAEAEPDEHGDGELEATGRPGPRQFLFGQIKNNLAARVETSVRYEIEGKHVGKSATTGKDIWSSKIRTVNYQDPASVEDAVAAREKAQRTLGPKPVELAEQYIVKMMTEHPDGISAGLAREELAAQGFASATCDRARRNLGITSTQAVGVKSGGWMWHYAE